MKYFGFINTNYVNTFLVWQFLRDVGEPGDQENVKYVGEKKVKDFENLLGQLQLTD